MTRSAIGPRSRVTRSPRRANRSTFTLPTDIESLPSGTPSRVRWKSGDFDVHVRPERLSTNASVRNGERDHARSTNGLPRVTRPSVTRAYTGPSRHSPVVGLPAGGGVVTGGPGRRYMADVMASTRIWLRQ